jgi:hypothetical protein
MANFNIDYLIVGGGGGAGAAGANGSGSGGGGAGGLLTSIGGTTLTLNASVTYDVIVGAGGSGAVSVVTPRYTGGDNGSDSEFSGTGITTITAFGGGGGGSGNGSGSNCNNCLPNDGGSGGGTGYGGPGAAGTAGQGNSGGISASGAPFAASGGGGAGGAGSGAPNNSTGGNGGAGLEVNITGGTGNFYAGGGGGSSSYNGTGVGGSGGSGIGGYGTSGLIGGDGSPNTGSGGGAGSSSTSGNSTGGDGSSGIVILRYTTADVASYTTTGSTPTEDTTTIPGQTILSFTTVGTGTIIFTTPTSPPFSGTKVTNPVTGFNSATKEGLKLPSGTNANQPSGVQGMIRNDTSETTGSSASAIEHHNGTNWQYFAATESLDPPDPLILSSVMYYSASDTTSYPGSGTDWFDLSGNSNTATITSSNYSNGYFDLTPTASIITTPVNTLYQTFSYSIWVKFDSVTPASGYVFTMLSKNQFYASNYQAFPFYAAVAPTGTFTSNLSYGNDYSPDVTNSTSVSANTWYNIACVIDTTTNTSKLYIGTESTQLALVNSVSYTGTLVDSRNEFYSLGKAPAERSGGVGKSSMDGKIAKFGFWDTALTEAELITIWGLGSGAT